MGQANSKQSTGSEPILNSVPTGPRQNSSKARALNPRSRSRDFSCFQKPPTIKKTTLCGSFHVYTGKEVLPQLPATLKRPQLFQPHSTSSQRLHPFQDWMTQQRLLDCSPPEFRFPPHTPNFYALTASWSWKGNPPVLASLVISGAPDTSFSNVQTSHRQWKSPGTSFLHLPPFPVSAGRGMTGNDANIWSFPTEWEMTWLVWLVWSGPHGHNHTPESWTWGLC